MKRPAIALILATAGLQACEPSPAPPPRPPNILWIVWDTVRADHLGLYGYERATTPFLDEWALGARVYEDCLAAGIATVPSHASMFTGLAVGEHGSHNANPTLAEGLDTLAELLARSGYGTYVWSANPHISGSHGFTQGFEVEQHPWDDRSLERARALVREKLRTDEAERFEGRVERGNKVDWAVKASGTLAREGLTEWLDGIDGGRPWFAFLNYMEAHRELVSSRSYRERFLSPERVERSYEIDTSWKRTWGYTFGLEEYSPEELEILAGVYDAAIAELDDLLRELLADLEQAGHLDHTIVVVTADHGEHLGEHHRLEHQYSLYQPLVQVPLIVRHPPAFAPGRDPRPVVNYDLFPTLLELAGLEPPRTPLPNGRAVSLLAEARTRARVAEYPYPFRPGLQSMRDAFPDFDPTPWSARWALVDAPWKLIWMPEGPAELYHLEQDPGELNDLSAERKTRVARMTGALQKILRETRPLVEAGPAPDPSQREREILSALGYTDGDEDEPAPDPGGDR